MPIRKVTTAALAANTDPLPYLDQTGVAWLRRGEGLVGLGVAAECVTSDPAVAARWWREWCANIEIDDDSGLGRGPLAFGCFPFDPGNTEKTGRLVVPKVVIGRQKDQAWITVVDGPAELPPLAAEPVAPTLAEVWDRSISPGDWCALVSRAAATVREGRLDKVVLARALQQSSAAEIDPRWPLVRLSQSYPSCWSFLIDGFLGASPEMLLRRQGGLVTSRVLAGTIKRTPGDDGALARALESSDKDLIEHEFAVASVASALAPHCSGMHVPDAPYVLRLPNVLHLASDVTGVAKGERNALELAAALHPSAAVCGTPTDAARAYIAANEGLDRGRYSGPVGWLDANGDGEWCIGLRSGQLSADRRSVTIYAGCGIVADSLPLDELAETRAKLLPMREALSVDN